MGEGVPGAARRPGTDPLKGRPDVTCVAILFFPFCCASEASVNNFSTGIIRDD